MKRESNNGITLVALVITIILMIILAGIVLSLTLGENGLFKIAKYAEQKNSEETAREKLEIALADLQAHKYSNKDYNENEYIDDYLSKVGMKVKQDIVLVDNWEFEIDRTIPRIIASVNKIDNNKSLFGEISYITKDGYYEVKINEESEDETVRQSKYNLHVIYHNGDLVLDGTSQVKGSTLNDKIYEFGDKNTDVATENEDAKNTVVLKVDGNLTINEGVTLTACKSDEGYGGPKGMIISCSGTITNKGIISMTSRGAKAEGENVYLWQNEDKTYEYVLAIGGRGGAGVSASGNVNGKAGNNAKDRQTGGGGSGSARGAYSGPGGNGTSYSGGTGGGGAHGRSNKNATGGSNTGGIGGNGGIYQDSSAWIALGGVGNHGGESKNWDRKYLDIMDGANGTGGLLIIFTRNFNNKGEITSNGMDNGSLEYLNWGVGGSSGGGSINIFYNNLISKGNITANGGQSVGNDSKSGAGGTGSITVGSIATGSFVPEYKNY